MTIMQGGLYEHHIHRGEAGEEFLNKAVYNEALHDAKKALSLLREKGESGGLPFFEIAFQDEDLSEAIRTAESYRKFQSVIVLGAGSGILAGRAFASLYQSWVMADSSFPVLYFLDNVDPDTFWEVMSVVNPVTTGVLILSHSGETFGVLMLLMRIIEYWRDFFSSRELSSRITLVTGTRQSSLVRLAKQEKISVIFTPSEISARFSPLTAMGLLPAMIVGAEGEKVRRGAGEVLHHVFSGDLQAPIEGAAYFWSFYKAYGLSIHVSFSYGDAFSAFQAWHRAFLAESLGKEEKGFTPLCATGPADQYSQLQLYLAGPKDKFFTFLSKKQRTREKPRADLWREFPELGCLTTTSIDDLARAEQNAVMKSLIERGCPVRSMSVAHLNEQIMGAFVMHFMIETLILGELLDIDPMTQPASDALRMITKRFLTNPQLKGFS